jgi:hypothetical protein
MCKQSPAIIHHLRNRKGLNTMTSFIRISDIPPDELYLLPIIGLRQQIREHRNRLSSPNSRVNEGEADGTLPGRAHHAEAPAAEVPLAGVERFVTDWQMQDEPRPSSRFRFDREGIDDDEDRYGEDFHDEDFDDSEDEDAGREEESYHADENHNTGEEFDALYVDIGGEG